MKKTIIISAMALSFYLTTANAETSKNQDNNKVETVINVNPFCVSIAKGDIETVKKLIEFGMDINQKSYGMTPVMYAAKYNRIDILKFLISKGAKLNSKSDKGKTALEYAELHKATEAVDIIREALQKK